MPQAVLLKFKGDVTSTRHFVEIFIPVKWAVQSIREASPTPHPILQTDRHDITAVGCGGYGAKMCGCD